MVEQVKENATKACNDPSRKPSGSRETAWLACTSAPGGASQDKGYLAPSRNRLPEYLEAPEVEALIRSAPDGAAALIMLIQWCAGLRVSETLGLTVADPSLEGERPTLAVRHGKGNRARRVPVHPELWAALWSALRFSRPCWNGHLVEASPSTAWRWVQRAYARAAELGALPTGKRITTHTLRHSAARHWLESGIPINVVSRWLGHASLQTTLIFMEVLPDPLGDIKGYHSSSPVMG